MEYNERWTSDKFIEYRKLKRSGYTDKMLIEHFGEDIYYSGMYNRKSTIMPWLEFITEITITPEYTYYTFSKKLSDIYKDKFDYIIKFQNNGVDYIISLFYYIIDNVETYNVLLTTETQWNEYEKKLNSIRSKGYIPGTGNMNMFIHNTEIGYANNNTSLFITGPFPTTVTSGVPLYISGGYDTSTGEITFWTSGIATQQSGTDLFIAGY